MGAFLPQPRAARRLRLGGAFQLKEGLPMAPWNPAPPKRGWYLVNLVTVNMALTMSSLLIIFGVSLLPLE